ncbi:MAG: 5-carboxymethyl-2-hydroxymuconate Delta-isomerase [Gammaproteobacteria bacterium]
MAHFILEYSANLKGELDVPGLLRAVHAAAVESAVFPLGGIRFRAVRCDEYLIADGDPENAFIHMSVRMGHGRTLETRKAVGEKLFAALTGFLAPIFGSRPLGISFEISELDPDLNFKKNNIHERLKTKGSR